MDNMIQDLVQRSREAQAVLATYDQKKIDEIVRMLAKVVYDNAEDLAQLAIEESGMGVYEDKVAKNKNKARLILNAMKNKPSIGVIERDEEAGLAIVAKPIGVVAAATPSTNPIVTPMCNAMFAVKCQNTIIIIPHPNAVRASIALAELYYKELDKMGVPRDIFLVVEAPNRDRRNELMASCDVVVATGGAGVVRAAYSSGKPSFGVGPGNVQGLIDRGIDYAAAAKRMLASRIFDNGIICSGTQTIIAPKEDYDEVINNFVQEGAFYIQEEEKVNELEKIVFPEGKINKDVVGKSVATIAQLAGLVIPQGTKAIVVKALGYGKDSYWSKEKLCPIMAAYSYETWEEAVEIAYANLMVEGAGHSVDIQSNNQEHIEYAGNKLPVSRIVVNQTCSGMAGGAFANSLNPTTTLGCGSWGGNSISENLFYTHLMNKSRIAYEKPNWNQPEDEEIFA